MLRLNVRCYLVAQLAQLLVDAVQRVGDRSMVSDFSAPARLGDRYGDILMMPPPHGSIPSERPP
jgi:hypothetical protein